MIQTNWNLTFKNHINSSILNIYLKEVLNRAIWYNLKTNSTLLLLPQRAVIACHIIKWICQWQNTQSSRERRKILKLVVHEPFGSPQWEKPVYYIRKRELKDMIKKKEEIAKERLYQYISYCVWINPDDTQWILWHVTKHTVTLFHINIYLKSVSQLKIIIYLE